MPSVYIHVPFCQSRCIYCDFYSTTSLEKQARYIERLEREMRDRQVEWDSRARTLSIYIGGGTPSTLPPRLMCRMMKTVTTLYPPAGDAEITIEANPDDVTEEWVEALKTTPVNRVSMGVQTFHDELLHTLRRRHSSEQARRAVQLLHKAGYTNISIDLIYGLPGQSLSMWDDDITEALRLGIPHISAYSLMYEEGTPITRMLESGLIEEMSDEMSWQCYELLCQRLQEAGYEHYEVSNFALPGMHSRHNSGYWTGNPYLGFGAGAHSYDGHRTRRSNKDSLDEYLNHPDDNEYFETEELTDTDLYNEYVMTRLRTSKGFALTEVEERFGREALHHCLEMMQPHLQKENLIRNVDQVYLSRKGVFVSNDVISDLFL